MTSLTQDVDQIIADEGIDNTTPAAAPDETPETPEVTPEAETPETPEETPESPETPEKPEGDDKETPETPEKTDETPEAPEAPKVPDGQTPTETVEQAQSFLSNLQLTEDKIFDETGNVKPFEEVIPAGAYLASQLTPVKVTDKDGKTHEFLLLQDVEDKFPEGFEAKNNIEQMKFEKAILGNETKFDEAVKTYNDAKVQYTKETSDLVQSRGDNERIGKEYRAMADQGLVPKIEGDPNDPKFLESAAVKELNGLLDYMDTKNKDLASKGLGQISSLYVAKQLMDAESTVVKKEDTKSKIDQERKEVASLSASPTPDTGDKKQQASTHVPLSRLADEIIAQEGLK